MAPYLAKDPDAVRRRIGMQLQQAVLPNRMKVKEAMAIFASAYARHGDPVNCSRSSWMTWTAVPAARRETWALIQDFATAG